MTYEALLMQAFKRWATAEEIGELAEQTDLSGVLDGLVHMRELEVTIFDDNVPCYRLTDFGVRFAHGIVAGLTH